MTRNKRLALMGLSGAILICAAIVCALVWPRPPDLMAHATKIVDLAGIDQSEFYWLDGHRLVATKGCNTLKPSIMSIDVVAKTITPLAAVNRCLARLPAPARSRSLLQGAIPSPDGQWLYCLPYPDQRHFMIRVCDGRYLPVADDGAYRIYWLKDSKGWVSLSFGKPFIMHSLDAPLKQRLALPPPRSYLPDASRLSKEYVLNAMGSDGTTVQKADRKQGRRDEFGVVSPDGTQLAWLRQDDWLDDVPPWIKRGLNLCGYTSHLSGEIWTMRIDGMHWQEVGQLGNDALTDAELFNFDWTPDGKRLIFDRGQVLYSVLVPESPAR